MTLRLDGILSKYVDSIAKVFGDKLDRVILFGSHAREDFSENSDIDVMILVDMGDKELKKYLDDVVSITFDFNMDYDVNISPILQEANHFNHWLPAIPFYQNVMSEGTIISIPFDLP